MQEQLLEGEPEPETGGERREMKWTGTKRGVRGEKIETAKGKREGTETGTERRNAMERYEERRGKDKRRKEEGKTDREK